MKRSKIVSVLLLITLMITTWLVPATSVQATSTFSDVSPSHWAYKSIMNLTSNGVIGGYPDGTFRPNNSITREEAAKIIVFAAGLPFKGKVSNFPDVPSTSWSTGVIAAARQNGIINGYPDGTFKPKGEISRQEAAAMVAKTFNVRLKSGATVFSDVANDSWAKKSIDILTSNNIVNGYSDGTFRPRKSISRAEFAVFISKAMKFGPAAFSEPAPGSVYVIMPTLPAEYGNVDYNGKAYAKIKMLEMTYRYDSRYGWLDFDYKAQKTYQREGTSISSVGFRYKIMKNGIVVATGLDLKGGLSVGDVFVESFGFTNVSPGIYEIFLYDWD